MSRSDTVLCVVGARPNYMKMAPIVQRMRSAAGGLRPFLVHTGQHYDEAMSNRLFADLQLPAADINLNVGSATHAVQTGEIMRRFEPVLDQHKPACVLVVGDVNSTLACALVATKKGIPVAHVEAGLRSFDRSMPEEINRILTDQISDILYTTETSAHHNLKQEGIPEARIRFVGNVMIDSLLAHRTHAVAPDVMLREAKISPDLIRCPNGYAVVTLHRPSNVDHPQTLETLLRTILEISEKLPVVWPLHPRTRRNAEAFGIAHLLSSPRLIILPPAGYLEMLGLMGSATVVLTDSGGIQEETTALAVPCLTLRENTERPITVEQGTNTVTGIKREVILAEVERVLITGGKRGRTPELWDGRAAERIVAHLAEMLLGQQTPVEA